MSNKSLYSILVLAIVIVAVIIVLGITQLSRRQQSETGLRPTNTVVPAKPDFSGELLPNTFVDPDTATAESPAQGAKLTAVGSHSGTAVTARHFDGSRFIHVITADLPDPPAGQYYQMWFAKSDGAPDYVSAGRLEFKSALWKYFFDSNQHYLDYPQVIVSIESEDTGAPTAPSELVLQGDYGL